jgi:predicted permease
LFLCIAVGFLLRKMQILPESAGKVMSKLEMYVFCPALSFITMAKYCTVETLAAHATNILFALCAMAIAIALAILFSAMLVKEKGPARGVYAYGLGFANSGYMGDPVVLVIFGPAALAYYKIYLLPLNVGTYTWGLAQIIPASEGEQHKMRAFLKKMCNPPIVSLLVAVAVGLSGLGAHLPTFLTTSLESLMACMGPVAMLLVGFTVAGYPLTSLLKKKKVYVATVLRLLLIPTVILAAIFGIRALANRLGAEISNTVLFLCFFSVATPLGLNSVVFPEAYGGDPEPGAAMALVSHTLCVLTIPLLYAAMTLIFGTPSI